MHSTIINLDLTHLKDVKPVLAAPNRFSGRLRSSSSLIALVLGTTFAFTSGCVMSEDKPDNARAEIEDGTDDPTGRPDAPWNPGSPAAPPVAVFQGFNSVIDKGLSTAVEGTTTLTGASSSVKVTVAESTSSLATALGVSAFGFAGVVASAGGGGILGKVGFYQSIRSSRYSVSVVVEARKILNTETVTDVHLKEDIIPPSDDGTALIDFVRVYGDEWVSARTTGGEAIGVYTFNASTYEKQRAVIAGLGAAGIVSGVLGAGGIIGGIASVSSSTNTAAKFQLHVSGIQNPVLPAVGTEALIDYILKFPSLDLDAPTVIDIKGTGYESVLGVEHFDKVVANRTYFSGGPGPDGKPGTGGLNGYAGSIIELQNQIRIIDDVHDFYRGYDDPKLTEVTGVSDADMANILIQVQGFVNDPTQDFSPLYLGNLQSLNYGFPELAYKVGDFPFFGRGGGNAFQDVNINNYVENKTRIAEISMRSGQRVDRLSTKYMSENGEWVATHGGGGGSDRIPLTVRKGDFVTEMRGRSGERVDRLEFYTADGQSIAVGGGGGGAFEVKVPEGGILMGFRGRSGNELDQISGQYFTFEPSAWKDWQ